MYILNFNNFILLCFLKWCIECFQWYLDTSCHVSRIVWKWTMTDNLYKKHECIRLFSFSSCGCSNATHSLGL